MGDRHLSLETMAKWLTGRLEHDDLLREVMPHHLEQCPGCREVYETLDALKREVGHWGRRRSWLPAWTGKLPRREPT